MAVGELSGVQGILLATGTRYEGGHEVERLDMTMDDSTDERGLGIPTIEFTACLSRDDLVRLTHDVSAPEQPTSDVVVRFGTVEDTSLEPHGWKVHYHAEVPDRTC